MSNEHSSIRYKKRHILLGLCGYCPTKLIKNNINNKTLLCDKCRHNANQRMLKLFNRRRAAGLCLYCENILAPNSKTQCVVHIEKRQRRTTMLLPGGLKVLTGKKVVERSEFIAIVERIRIESVDFIKTLPKLWRTIFVYRFLATEINLLKDIAKELNISRRWANVIEQELVGVYRDYIKNRHSSSIESNSSGGHFFVNQELCG